MLTYNSSMEPDTDKLDIIKKWLGTGSINIFGKQFSGKDTQCERLAEAFDGAVIGGGDILRGSNTPQYILDIIAEGHLSPTQEYRAIVTPYFSRPEYREQPLFLSSVGRMQGEEETIMEAALTSNHHIRAVIALEVSDSEIWRRYDASRANNTRARRADDDFEGLTRRLNLYHEQTLPVIATYDKLGLLIRINGQQPPEAVYDDIIDALYERARTNRRT